jgi:hypothetical protein
MLTGCGGAKEAATNAPSSQAKPVAADGDIAGDTAGFNQIERAKVETARIVNRLEVKEVSLPQTETLASTAEAADRKIIRNASLTMEVNSTTDTQHRVTSIAESHGGFVVTSESKQREDADPNKRTLDIKLVVRIPATQFGAALDAIRGLANNLREENITGNDVTEEFIDLEARIKTQRALELQFLEIMKQAHKVEDALEVQRQIADVRTDIEKLEGRKRFLENRASLSTITVNIEAPRQIAVSPTGFGRDVRETVSDSIDLGAAIILFLVRFLIVMIPITLFVLLPLGLVVRYLVRRAQRIQLAQALSTPPAD